MYLENGYCTLAENQHIKAEKDENMLKLFQQAAGMEIRITDGELHILLLPRSGKVDLQLIIQKFVSYKNQQ